MAAAPCHHSKDQPAPTHRGRDRLRRRRQRPSQVRSKTSGARPCEASGALLLSNGGTGGGHAACTLWPPPAPFGYFPVMESTSSARRRTKPLTRNGFLVDGREGGFLAFLCFAGFRLCGGDQRAFRSPFGNLRGTPFEANGGPQVNWFLVDGKEGSFLVFLCFAGFRLGGGEQRAFRSPFGNLRGTPFEANGGPHVNRFLVDGGEGSFLAFLCFAGVRLCGGDQRAFRSPFGNLRSPLLLKGTCKKILVSGNEREPSLRFLFRGRQPSAPPQVVLSLS